MALIFYFVIIFLIIGAVGYRYSNSWRWDAIDVVYYPLAAIGIVLLFADNVEKRQSLNVDRLVFDYNQKFERIPSEVSTVKSVQNLINTSFRMIQDYIKLGSYCRTSCSVMPACFVAKQVDGQFQSFLNVANGSFDSNELRLATSCAAAENLVNNIRVKQLLSYAIINEVITQYREAKSKHYNSFEFEAMEAHIAELNKRASAEVAIIIRNGFEKESAETKQFTIDMYNEEIRVGSIIIYSLFPCIVANQKEIDVLNSWSGARKDAQAELARVEQGRSRSLNSLNFLVRWGVLNLWPIVLIAALSLKFGKGVASLCKAIEKRRSCI
jgi:hypothetical protein